MAGVGMHRTGVALAVALVLGPNAAHASRTITGTVFFDKDQDGVFSSGDEIFADGYVFWETTPHMPIDESGTYAFTAADAAGIVWVRAQPRRRCRRQP